MRRVDAVILLEQHTNDRTQPEIVHNILVVAPTCDGTDVGEAWVAYQWVRHLSIRNNVTLLTYHKRGKIPAKTQFPGVRVIEWSEPPLLGKAERLNSLLKPAYLPFYVRARQWIKRSLACGADFDLIHQPLPVAMRYPSPAAGLGIPLIVGPVGGGLTSPEAFEAEEGSAPWYVGLRRIDRLRLIRDPLLRATYESADCVLGIAPYVLDQLEGLKIRRFQSMSETALVDLPAPTDRSMRTGPVRMLTVGRLVRTKGARDSIVALSRLPDGLATLDIVGDGPDRSACEALVKELRVQDRVKFHGALSRSDVNDFYERADLFVFPSYREPGGNVVFEAMGHGLPLIVVDRGGPGAATDDSCAIRLTADSPEQLAEDLAGAMRRLIFDANLRQAMGTAARSRAARKALWSTKVLEIEHLYVSILGQ